MPPGVRIVQLGGGRLAAEKSGVNDDTLRGYEPQNVKRKPCTRFNQWVLPFATRCPISIPPMTPVVGLAQWEIIQPTLRGEGRKAVDISVAIAH
jgi:hypothetical protein